MRRQDHGGLHFLQESGFAGECKEGIGIDNHGFVELHEQFPDKRDGLSVPRNPGAERDRIRPRRFFQDPRHRIRAE